MFIFFRKEVFYFLLKSFYFLTLLFFCVPISTQASQVDSLKFDHNLKQFQKNVFSNTDSARYYLEQLDALSKKDPKSIFRYRYYVQLGAFAKVIRDTRLSFASYKTALELAQELGDKEFIVKSRYNLGSAYAEIGEFDKALPLFKEVELGLNDVKTNYTLFSNQFRANMVQLYVSVDLSLAFKYSDQMKANLKSYDDSTMYYLSRLQLLRKAKRNEENIKLGEEALQKISKDNLHFRCQVLINMGLSYFDLSNNEMAFKSFFEAKNLSTKLGAVNGLTERMLGLLYFKTHDYKNAILQFNKVLDLSQKQGTLATRTEVMKNLSDVYKAQGKYAEALNYLEKYAILKDSVGGVEKIKAIQDTEAKYELMDKEKIIEQQKEVNSLQEALLKEEHRRGIVLIGFLVCAVLLAGALWFFYRRTIKTNKQLVVQRNQIEEYAAELKSANMMRDKLFAMISHDLRSPVSSLVHSLEEYESTKPHSNLMHALNNVQLILNNLLKWAQIQLSEKPYRPKDVHLDWILGSIVNQFASMINEKQIQILTDYKHSGTVWVDEESLLIVLRNILSNAVKFTGENGLIRITTEEENGTVHLTIRDSGIGLNAKQLEDLFVYPESRSGTSGETGTGLGMTLTKELVDKMNGEITVKSKEGVGTSVELILPVK